MKNILFGILFAILLVAGGYYIIANSSIEIPEIKVDEKNDNREVFYSETPSPTLVFDEIPSVMVVARDLDTPWGIVFLPDKTALVTERKGTVRFLDSNLKLDPKPVINISAVKEIGEGGLLGIDVHPDFETNKYVYVYYTFAGNSNETLNRVSRFIFENSTLINEEIILNNIPGAANHNGGRIKFGSDKNLYIGTGDAGQPSQAQNTNSLAGKILRVKDNGSPADGNPFNNEVYSYGHRNVQGLAWDSNNNLWSTEHGRSGIRSGLDELNLIEVGKNYGWPDIEGNETKSGIETPKQNSGASDTWAPGGIAIINNNIYFAGLRGSALYSSQISGTSASDVKVNLKNVYGRIRDVLVGPDGMLYISTSNKDGRGVSNVGDDKIIRVNPDKL